MFGVKQMASVQANCCESYVQIHCLFIYLKTGRCDRDTGSRGTLPSYKLVCSFGNISESLLQKLISSLAFLQPMPLFMMMMAMLRQKESQNVTVLYEQ